MRKIYIFVVVALLCCEFSEETLQGPPSENKKRDDPENSEVVSNAVDTDEESALKIVPAPDLTKEKEHKKGKLIVRTRGNGRCK